MYRRYSQMGDGSMPLSQVNRNRIKNIIILLLLIALIAVLVISVPVLTDRGETRALYIRRIQAECDDAARQTASLSRNAGADSAAILSKVRCNIYAIRLLTLQNTVDRYLSFITTGMDTGEYQTSLQTALAELQEIVGTLN